MSVQCVFIQVSENMNHWCQKRRRWQNWHRTWEVHGQIATTFASFSAAASLTVFSKVYQGPVTSVENIVPVLFVWKSELQSECLVQLTSFSLSSASYLSWRFLYSNCHFSAFMASAECLVWSSWAYKVTEQQSELVPTSSETAGIFKRVHGPDCV